VFAAAGINAPACMAASPARICVSPDRATIATELPGASGDDSPASPATATVAHTGAAAAYCAPSTAVNTTTPHGIAPTTAAEPTAMRDNHAATAAAETTTTAAGAAAPCFGNGYGDHEAQTQGDAHHRCCFHSSHNTPPFTAIPSGTAGMRECERIPTIKLQGSPRRRIDVNQAPETPGATTAGRPAAALQRRLCHPQCSHLLPRSGVPGPGSRF
jgi:hypothetical protein